MKSQVSTLRLGRRYQLPTEMLSNAFSASTTWICLEFAVEDPERESMMLRKAETMLTMNKAVYEDELLLVGVKGKYK